MSPWPLILLGLALGWHEDLIMVKGPWLCVQYQVAFKKLHTAGV